MREYLSYYGWHFSKRMCDWAVSCMKTKDEATGKAKKLEPWSKQEVEDMLKRNGVTIEHDKGYDCVYTANMLKSDFYKKSIADEAHLYIDPKFPIALDFFYSMSKRIRKYNGSFIPATQNIADWNANEELCGKTSAIIKNSQYSFIFKLSAPDMKDVLDIYKAGDSFNDEEQRMIISAVTGQTFFVGSTELRNCILVKAGDYTQSLFEERKEEETN